MGRQPKFRCNITICIQRVKLSRWGAFFFTICIMTAKGAKKLLVILDAHAILHRAYHALPSFTSSKGEPTGAVYGLSLMLLSIIKEFAPDQIIACFDMAL